MLTINCLKKEVCPNFIQYFYCVFTNKVFGNYNHKYTSYADKRVDGFYLMSSPFPVLLICAGYIYFIKYMGPRLMRDRRPFELKGLIIFYNIIQLFLNTYLVYKVSNRIGLLFTIKNQSLNAKKKTLIFL